MKILILANSDIGLFKFRRELLEELVKQHQVFVSVPAGEFTKEIQAAGCEILENIRLKRRGTNPLQDLKLLRHYCKLIRGIKPGLVLTYTIKPNVYGGIACGWYRVPYIANVTGLGTAVESGGILGRVTLFLYGMGLKKARKVFFQNVENRDFFLNHNIVKGNYEVLPGSGVNTTQHCYEAYPADTKELVFATIGRLMRDKGIDEILSAARIIKSKYPKVRFLLAGSFEENYEKKVTEAQEAGFVEYVGQKKDIHPLIKESHAVLHASYHEGMSNVLLEAASTGRPVIATDIPGCREIFEESVSGIGFRAKSTEDLVLALKKFIDLPYEKKKAMGEAGREKIKREFDRSIVVETYLREIEEISEKKPVHVLAVVSQMKPGGLENRLMDIMRAIDSRRVRIDVFSYRLDEGNYDKEIGALGGKVYYNPPLTVKNMFWYVGYFKRFLQEHPEYQIVHAHQNAWCSVFCKGAFLAGIPVRIAHSRTAVREMTLEHSIKNIIKIPTRKYANYYFAVSEKAGRWLYGNKIYDSGRVRIWPNSIQASAFYYKETLRFQVRKQYGWVGTSVLMHVGSFSPPKTLPGVLEVFKKAAEFDRDAVLVLVGGGNQEKTHTYIQQNCLEHRVFLLGSRSDVNELLQGADVFLFPSFFEGLPGAVVEAQAAGLPCVISDTIAKEVCITPGVECLSLKKGAEFWAKRVLKQKGRTREDTRNYIEKAGFDIDSLVRQLTEFYENT